MHFGLENNDKKTTLLFHRAMRALKYKVHRIFKLQIRRGIILKKCRQRYDSYSLLFCLIMLYV